MTELTNASPIAPEVTAPVSATNPPVENGGNKVPEISAEASQKLAAIAKRDKAALMRMRAAQAKEQEIAQREAKLKEFETKYNQKPANPIEALMNAGFSYQDATNFVLNGEKLTPDIEVKKVRSELEEYKRQQEQAKKETQEAQLQALKAQEQEVIQNFQTEISDFIDAHSGEYELIKMHNAENIVFTTINEHFSRTSKDGKPKIMSTKEASDLVEQYLYDKIEESVTKAGRFKGKFTQPESKVETNRNEPSKTLTNNMSSSAASTLPARTEQDRINRALAALNKSA